MRGMYHDNKLVEAVVPAVLTTTPGSFPNIDLQGFDQSLICVQVGAGGITFTSTNKLEIVLEHGDATDAYAAVTSADVTGVTVASGGIIAAYTAAKAASNVQKVGYKGGKRYIRVRPVFGGTHATGTAVAATAVLGKPELTQDVS